MFLRLCNPDLEDTHWFMTASGYYKKKGRKLKVGVFTFTTEIGETYKKLKVPRTISTLTLFIVCCRQWMGTRMP